MELKQLNEQLKRVASAEDPRAPLFEFAGMLVQWLGIEMQPNWPVMQEPINVKQRNYLVLTPTGRQPQKYRYTDRTDPVYVRFAVVKSLRKQTLNDFAERDLSFQTMAAQLPADKRELSMMLFKANAYHLHLFTTANYDRLVVVVSQGEQKRIVTFKDRLSHTQYNRLLPAWKGITAKSKLEVMNLLWASLDIREVNKEFYQRIKERFDDLIGILETEYPKASDTQRKQFAVRIIGRYIFCWFLKEKGIIPSELISSEAIDAHRSNYHQVYLRHLFLNTLNEEVQARTAISTGSQLDKLYDNIPYLNGGLFEEHPEDSLFAKAKVNDWLLGFVQVLESYDFTVDESSSTYQHVAIDPEMLGRIFENLLASQNPETEKLANTRKAFGAFYTPREIVEYMVNGALRSYLERKLLPPAPPSKPLTVVKEPKTAYKGLLFPEMESQQTQMDWDPAETDTYNQRHKRVMEVLDRFFEHDRSDNPFSKDDTLTVKKALAEITVLDPACGSGAFPMSMLLRLMELREIVGHGHNSRYGLKDEILSKNIYGVDIMPMAVEIARLRAWLSLVLESDFKRKDRTHNFGIKALPNLDFKFVCANSLVDSGYDAFLSLADVSNNATLLRLGGEIEKLEHLRHNYYDPKGDKGRKEELRKEFLETKDDIKRDFAPLRKSWKLGDFLDKVDDWDPFDDSRPSSFFSSGWMFGIKNGFDVVIGNPPWGSDLTKQEKAYLKDAMTEIDSSTPNSFAYLIGAANRLASTVVSFVLPDSILIKDYAKTRALIAGELRSVDWYQNTGLPEPIRPFVYVEHDVAVLIWDRGDKELVNYSVHEYSSQTKQISRRLWVAKKSETILERFENAINLKLDADDIGILKKIWSLPMLDSVVQCHEGIHTGNSRDILFHQKRINKNCKPLFYGGRAGDDIHNYKSLSSGWYVDYRKEIINKEAGNYASLRDERIFSLPKVYITRTGNPFKCFYDENFYASNNFFSLQHVDYKQNTREFLYQILALLNSKFTQYFIRTFAAPRLGETYVETKIVHLLKIPFENPTEEIKTRLLKLVSELIELSGQQSSIDKIRELELQLNICIYRMYNLTHAEVLVIDPAFGLSEEEYNTFKVG